MLYYKTTYLISVTYLFKQLLMIRTKYEVSAKKAVASFYLINSNIACCHDLVSIVRTLSEFDAEKSCI